MWTSRTVHFNKIHYRQPLIKYLASICPIECKQSLCVLSALVKSSMMIPVQCGYYELKRICDFIAHRSLHSPTLQHIRFGEVEQFCHNGTELCP